MFKLLITTLACLTIGTMRLSAGSITVYDVDWQRFGVVNIQVDGISADEYAGVIKAYYDGSAPLDLFCVDLFTHISFDTYTSQPIYPRAANHEDRVAYLYANVYNPIVINTPELGEAMQIAFWDIVHDNGDGPNAGRIQASASTPAGVVLNWVNYLSLSAGQSSNNASIFLNSQGLTQFQTLIGAFMPGVTGPPPPTVTNEQLPEPSTFSLFAGAILVGGAVRFRRKR